MINFTENVLRKKTQNESMTEFALKESTLPLQVKGPKVNLYPETEFF